MGICHLSLVLGRWKENQETVCAPKLRVGRFETAEVFTQHDMEEHLRTVLLQACHRTAQGGRVGIRHLPSVLGRWKENLWGRGADSQYQRGSSVQKDKDSFW